MGDMFDVLPSPPPIHSETMDGLPRKQQKRSSNNNSATSIPSSTSSGAMGSQSGPPYVCPTCQTSYSRLEYLRRHERRREYYKPHWISVCLEEECMAYIVLYQMPTSAHLSVIVVRAFREGESIYKIPSFIHCHPHKLTGIISFFLCLTSLLLFFFFLQ